MTLPAPSLAQPRLYCTKDTYVSHVLQTVGSVEPVEKQTAVAYVTLKKHNAK